MRRSTIAALALAFAVGAPACRATTTEHVATDGGAPKDAAASQDPGTKDAYVFPGVIAATKAPLDGEAPGAGLAPPDVGAPVDTVPATRPCNPDAGLRRPPDKDDDIIGADGCRPVPSRFVVLGDSIARCYGLSTGDICSSRAIAAELKNQFSPDLVFESHAMDGSGVMDLPGQAAEVAPGPGHVYVWIFSVGNDLLDGLLFGGDLAPYQAALNMAFDYFSSKDRFPDGATFLLNGQYALYDQCDVPGSVQGYTPAFADRLREVNQALLFDPATARSDTIAIDQYTDWLGHGNNANVYGCPYCGSDNSSWMVDGFHPNSAGHAHILSKWLIAFRGMLEQKCGRDL
jgi:hypothetical protein